MHPVEVSPARIQPSPLARIPDIGPDTGYGRASTGPTQAKAPAQEPGSALRTG
jgi:hypothetical protein